MLEPEAVCEVIEVEIKDTKACGRFVLVIFVWCTKLNPASGENCPLGKTTPLVVLLK